MKKEFKAFLYRIEVVNKEGKAIKHLAEVQAVLDETARREIVHRTMMEGGRVIAIVPTDDRTRYPGELQKRSYGAVVVS